MPKRVRAAATRVADGHTTDDILPVLAPAAPDVPVQDRCGPTIPVPLHHREFSGGVAHNDLTAAVRCRGCQQLSKRVLSPRRQTGFAELKDEHTGDAIR